MAKKLSRKELVAFTQMIISILAFFTFGALSWIQVFHLNFYLLGLQLLSMSIGLICLLFAFSPWFYLSNIAIVRFHSRILCVCVLWLLFLLLTIDLILYNLETMFGIIQLIEQKIEFKAADRKILFVALIVSCLIAILLFIINVFLTSIIAHKSRKHRVSQRRSSANKLQRKRVTLKE